MFLKLLNEYISNPKLKNIYSFGIVDSKTGLNTYKIRFENDSIEIFTKEILNEGEWIRFIGKKEKIDGNKTDDKNEIIFCEFVTVLKNFNVLLLIKAIKVCNENT